MGTKKKPNKIYFFDLENSKLNINGETFPHVYLCNLLQYDFTNNEIIESKFFRNLIDFRSELEKIDNDESFTHTIYCHNLNYELSFLKNSGINLTINLEEDSKTIFRDTTSPICIEFLELKNIIFKCSYALFNTSVASLGDKIKFPKLEYNYEKVRLDNEELEQLDYEYNERDNLIVAKSMSKYLIENSYTIDNLPLTFTGNVKQIKRNFINNNFSGKNPMYSLYLENQLSYFNEEFYNVMTKTYRGGLTGCTIGFIDKELSNVYSVDKKSDYPHQMLNNRFPLFKDGVVEHFKENEADEVFTALCMNVEEVKGTFSYFGKFLFSNLKAKRNDIVYPISNKKDCMSTTDECKMFNGKYYEIEALEIYLNDVDMETINLCYDYDFIACDDLYFAPRTNYLSEKELSFLLEMFNRKENVKDKESEEYKQSKEAINGLYGTKVQKPLHDEFYEEDGYIKKTEYIDLDEEDKNEALQTYIEKGRKFNENIYFHGVYITSYARLELIKTQIMLNGLGANVVYSDTDSVKFQSDNIELIMKEIEKLNIEIVNKNVGNVRFKKYVNTLGVELSDFEIQKISRLGIWEFENEKDENGILIPYDCFKTLGAKKYCYVENGKFKTTIAGCSKSLGKYFTEYMNNKSLKVDEAMKLLFSPYTIFSKEVSGRTISYCKENTQGIYYNGYHLKCNGGTYLENTTYTLNIGQLDEKLLESLTSNQYIHNRKNPSNYKYFDGSEMIYDTKIVNKIINKCSETELLFN